MKFDLMDFGAGSSCDGFGLEPKSATVSAIPASVRWGSMNQHVARTTDEAKQIVVAGYLTVDPASRDEYLAGFREVVRQARLGEGCLDFAISPDLLDSSRINIFERWRSQGHAETFRGSGPSDDQSATMTSASVVEYDVDAARSLT
jgi:quinol monooxygenase YgiN